jgi:uncharacterized protein (DUF2237 family)
MMARSLRLRHHGEPARLASALRPTRASVNAGFPVNAAFAVHTGAVNGETNVFGTELQACGSDPVTGFYRDGCCGSGPAQARHLVCAVVTADFLDHQRSVGNDLITPVPDYGFPGLRPGDRWCVVAERWAQAYEAGVAPPVVLAATNARALEVIDLAVLRPYAVDVPEDLSSLE